MVAQVPNAEESRDRAAGTFLACLNHEVRTPLSGIIGMVDLLLETPLDEEQREYVSAARLCAENLFELLNATLEYSALQAGQCSLDENEFSVREVLESIMAQNRPKAEAKDLRLFLTFDSRLPETLIGDAPRLKELLGHFLANAIKFTNLGSVELRASCETVAGPSESLILSVRDTGVGIPAEKLSGIFDSFRQGETGLARGYAGMGLGLAVARSVATLMKGTIDVASQVGAGSTFTAKVPMLRPKPVIETIAESPEVEIPADGPWILAVDDNPVGLKVLKHLLQRRRLGVETVESAKAAFAKARLRTFDLVLMDLQMPDMDGLTAALEFRTIPGYENTPILALTANYSDQVREQCRSHGMQAFLSKPIDAQQLWGTLARYLPAWAAAQSKLAKS